MQFLAPKPDLQRSLATLLTAMDTGREVQIWRPAITGFFSGFVPITGVPIRVRPEEGSGKWWLVTLDDEDGVVEWFVKLDEWPRVGFVH